MDELHWMEHVMLPNQLRIRASSALFTALEHCDNAIEITDYDKIVQVSNKFHIAHAYVTVDILTRT